MKAKINRFFNRIIKVLNSPHMSLLPGGLAFFMVLSTMPTLTLITYITSVLNLSLDFIYEFLEKAFSKEFASLFLSSSTMINSGIKLTIVLIICYFLSSNGMNSVIETSNHIYGIENGSWFKRRVKAIIMSLILTIIITFMLFVPLLGDTIIGLIQRVNINTLVTEKIIMVFSYLKSPIMVIFLYFMIKIIYMLAPDKKIKFHNANYGAVFTTILWIIVTNIYSSIIEFGRYSSFYGGLAYLCVIMIWFYMLSYIFVIGMALNYQRENEKLEKNTIINN